MFGSVMSEQHTGSAVFIHQRNQNTLPYQKNRPGNAKGTLPTNNDAKPNYTPETLTRQQLRAMLRTKAKADIRQQYGHQGIGGVCYQENFPRRARRKVVGKITHRWYGQIRENLESAHETRKVGFVKQIMGNIFSKPQGNTLKASGVTA